MIKTGLATIRNIQIYYKYFWDKSRSKTLVMLHEGLGSIGQWKQIPDWIFDHSQYNVLVYDRTGYGQSSAAPKDYPADYLRFEADIILRQLLALLNIESISLLGHSDGGSVALLFAAYHPKLTDKVITEAAHVIIENLSRKGIRQVKEIYATKLKPLLEKHHGEKTDWVFYHWANTWLNQDFHDWNMLKELENIKCPILAIQGEDDEYGSIEQLNIINTVETSEILLIKNCGHHPHFQKAEITLEKILSFLNVN